MTNATDIRTGRHCVFNLNAHLVFVTKYRRKVFTNAMLQRMQQVMTDICDGFEAELVEFNGEHDHVHSIVFYPPKVALAKLVNSLKGCSSRVLRRKFSSQIGKFYWKGML